MLNDAQILYDVNVDKKCTEPIICHKIPSKNWEAVAVELFDPTSSLKHTVVTYDLLQGSQMQN